MVPSEEEGAPQTGVRSREVQTRAARVSRKRDITSPRGPWKEYWLSFATSINKHRCCRKCAFLAVEGRSVEGRCWPTSYSAVTMQANTWLTGNRLPPAFAERAPAKTPRDNFRISTKRRGTQWWRSNWRSISKLPDKTPMRRNGIPPPPNASGERIGRRRRKKQRSGWAAYPERFRWKQPRRSAANLL